MRTLYQVTMFFVCSPQTGCNVVLGHW